MSRPTCFLRPRLTSASLFWGMGASFRKKLTVPLNLWPLGSVRSASCEYESEQATRRGTPLDDTLPLIVLPSGRPWIARLSVAAQPTDHLIALPGSMCAMPPPTEIWLPDDRRASFVEDLGLSEHWTGLRIPEMSHIVLSSDTSPRPSTSGCLEVRRPFV